MKLCLASVLALAFLPPPAVSAQSAPENPAGTRSASLILGPEYDGRFLVMDVHRRLVAELVKPAGRRVELGLEPGSYQVYYEQQQVLLTTTLRLDEGQRQELAQNVLIPTQRLPATRPADEEPQSQPKHNLDGRWRILFQGGLTNAGASTVGPVTRAGGTGGMQVSTWVRPDLSLDFRVHVLDGGVVTSPTGTTSGGDVGYLVGARYHPRLQSSMRPHVGGSIGAFSFAGSVTSRGSVVAGVGGTRLGGTLEGGLDFRFGGNFLMNLDGILTLRDNQSSQLDIALGFGFIFGGGRKDSAAASRSR